MTGVEAVNAASLLGEAAARHPDRPALLGGECVTFGELWDRVDRCSAGLLRSGLRAGDRAICMIPMSVDLYVVLLGLMKAGAVAVFVDPWIGMAQIAAFSAFAEPRAWLGVPRSHVLRLFQGRLRHLPVSVTTGTRLGPLPARLTLRELLASPGDGIVHRAGPENPALVTFTSGSSGTPKGANRTHGFLRAQHAALRAEFPARTGDVDMTMFPVFALNNIALGVPTVIPDLDFRRVAAADAARLRAQMERHAVTTCTASPPFFDRLAALDRRPPLRRILTGGAPVSDRQLETWRAAWPGTEILVAYGSTEAEPVAHISAPERLEALRRSPRPAPATAQESRRRRCGLA
jgi:olefin beta-lactone synthetase